MLFPVPAFGGWFSNLFSLNKEASVIKNITPIDFQWPVQEPFLFCVHHQDFYPSGNKNLGLESKYFAGRMMGQDFEVKDGFRIYHGKEIPGFPVHPHRGFETITIVRKGYVDHADSLGAAGRYGEGDVQWMTAGAGVQHSEMFPLLHADKKNEVELFQIWLNLPKVNKMVPPDFKMLWANEIPKIKVSELVELSLIAGKFEDHKFYEAPKNSWAASPEHEVNIFLVKVQKDGVFKLPASKIMTNRSLYFFEGESLSLNGEQIQGKKSAFVDSNHDLEIIAKSDLEFLFLEAKPIGESIYQHGPFVMNSRQEIMQAFHDYQKTEFGGWPWPRQDMIHGDKIEKFAKYPNGKIVRPI